MEPILKEPVVEFKNIWYCSIPNLLFVQHLLPVQVIKATCKTLYLKNKCVTIDWQ